MNFWHDDYVMGHLLSAARYSGEKKLDVDLLSGVAGPKSLLVEPVALSVESYCRDFPDLVTRSGADPSFVTSASLQVEFDTSISYPVHRGSRLEKSPYVCTVRVTDDRGRLYESVLRGWWYPEKVAERNSFRRRLRRLFKWAT